MESWGTHPSSDSEKKLNLSLCLCPPNNVAKGNLTSCSYRLWRKVRCTCKICCFSFTYWVHFVWHSHCPSLQLSPWRCCSQDLSMCVKGYESEYIFSKNAFHLFTRYICHSRFGPLMNYFVYLETDIWVERKKKFCCFRKKLYFKETTRVEWIEANCALK